jgi:8-oxo-dGTP diphosphatase
MSSSLWYEGVNPVVDLVVVRTHPEHGLQALLIQRGKDVDAEAGKWALPGGFQNTDAKKDTHWASGVFQEQPNVAALRECNEETGLAVDQLIPHLKQVGIYRGPGRDPRETDSRFTESHAFFLSLDGLLPLSKSDAVFGLDDAAEARWINWRELRTIPLAFDHDTILTDTERFLSETWRNNQPSKPKNKR